MTVGGAKIKKYVSTPEVLNLSDDFRRLKTVNMALNILQTSYKPYFAQTYGTFPFSCSVGSTGLHTQASISDG